jgi:thiamine-phosphate pyrophosphorylase
MKAEDPDRGTILRILDANANRCAEGLRVIEEMARFSRADEALQRALKRIRHQVREAAGAFGISLLAHRDSTTDVGREATSRTEGERGSLQHVVQANFSRVQEALRVLEEYGKLIDPEVAAAFKRLRFELYTIQKELGLMGRSRDLLPSGPFLYAILDRAVAGPAPIQGIVEALLDGGARVIQYRAKGAGTGAQREDLERMIAAAGPRRVPVIVNDDPALAREVSAQGVHLGIDDAPVAEARHLLGPDAIVGATVHTMPEFESLPLEKIDYVAVGSVFASPTKPDVPVCGLGFLRSIRERAGRIPVVAIGGITVGNVDSVLDAGAAGVALVSALLQGDIRKNCFTFKQIIDRRLD